MDGMNETDGIWSPTVALVKLPGFTPPYDGSEVDEEKMATAAEQLFSELEDVDFNPTQLLLSDDNSNDGLDSLPGSSHSEKSCQSKNCESDDDDYVENVSHLISSATVRSKKIKVKPDKSTSRNAVVARRNRERKKKYINGLESSIETVTAENIGLKKKVSECDETIADLRYEVKYLRCLLSNGSELSRVLNAVCKVPGMKVASNLLEVNKKRSSIDDHTYYEPSGMPPPKKSKSALSEEEDMDSSTTGICLHVSSGNVSVEMCHKCNEQHVKSNSTSS